MQDEREKLRAAGFTDAEIDAELGPARPVRPTVRVPAESSAMQGPGKAPARASGDLDYAKGLLRQAGQGASLGFADEIEAGARSMLGAGPYRATRDGIRAENDAFSRENPKASLAANLAGGIATGGLAAGAAKGAGLAGRAARVMSPRVDPTLTLAQRLGQAAKVGGATGAIGGAGVAEELADVPRSAAIGGTVGGVAGALFAGAGEAIRSTRNMASRVGQGQQPGGAVRRAVRAESPEEAAVRRLLQRVGSQKQTLDGVVEKSAAADAPDILGEVVGGKAVRDVRAARGLGYEAPDMIENSLLERARNDVGRVRATVRNELGEQMDDVALAAAKRTEAQQAAGPLYEQALEGVTITDPRVVEMVKRPAIRTAYNTARRLAANDGAALPPVQSILRGAMGGADDMADDVVGGVAVNAARTDGGSLRDVSKVGTAELLDELEALTTRQQRDTSQSLYNYVETNIGGGNYGVVVPKATKKAGGGPSMQAKAQRRVDQTNGVIDRLFEELDRRGVDWADAMAKRAAGEVPDLADDVARTVPGRGKVSLPNEGDAPELPTLTGRQVQYIKHALDDQITRLEGKTGGTATKEYAQLVRARGDVDELLYEFANQGEEGASLWGQANQTYAKPMQELDAFTVGKRSGRQVDEADVSRLLSGERPEWTARGVANTIQDDLGRMGDGAVGPLRDPAPVLMGSTAARARLRVAANGDEAKVARIQQMAANASRRLKTRQTVIGNSQTAEKLADQAEMGMDPSAFLQGVRSPGGALLGAVGKGANALRRTVVGEEMDALARLLMAGAPGQMTREEALAQVQALAPSIAKLAARQAMRRGAVAGATGRAAAGAIQ